RQGGARGATRHRLPGGERTAGRAAGRHLHALRDARLRIVRLGVPATRLSDEGRSRAGSRALFETPSWSWGHGRPRHNEIHSKSPSAGWRRRAMSGLQFGIFDWLDDGGQSLAEAYEQRLKMLEYADRAGYFAYHLAEHHGTPLSTAPSPNLFFA